MPKLNDLKSILLATAAARDNSSIYPIADSIAGTAGHRLTKAVAALIKTGFAEERETLDQAAVCRTEGDLSYGVFITSAGADAIGVAEPAGGDASGSVSTDPLVPDVPRASKTSVVLTLLQRDGGATMAELIAVTGWLPHTTRAALTGLRKKGHVIDRGKRNDATCYRIAAAAAA